MTLILFDDLFHRGWVLNERIVAYYHNYEALHEQPGKKIQEENRCK